MKRTIYFPEALDRRLLTYVRTRPGTTISSVIQQAVDALISRNDPHRILRLAGLVRRASGPGARDRAEDSTIGREREQ
ncbi:MAG TPA: hypothetical protein VKT83_14875 [bacterium]|nr:hypothetical protein [bacterium]